MHNVMGNEPATQEWKHPSSAELAQLIRDARLQRSLEVKRMLLASYAWLRPASEDPKPTRTRRERLLREVNAVDGKVVVTVAVSIVAVSLVRLILG